MAKKTRGAESPFHKTIHPLTSLTIVFYILLGILFLLIYLQGWLRF